MKYVIVIFILCLSLDAVGEDFNARLIWADRVVLGTPLSGIVNEVLVKVGQKVKQGESLLRLDDAIYQAKLDEARANYRQSKADRDEADRELERTMDLYDRTLISEHEKDLALVDHARAGAVWGKANSRLIQAKLALRYATIHAPFDGLVLSMNVSQGQMIVNKQSAERLLVLVRRGQMQARSYVSLQQLVSLDINMPLKVQIDNVSYNGRVNYLGFEAESEVSGFRVDVLFDDPSMSLVNGQSAQILF